MRKKFLLFRPSQTRLNAQGIIQGRRFDENLSEEGLKEALSLAHQFNYRPKVIYSSPLKRAYSTARLVSPSNCLVITYSSLIEVNMGQAEGLSFDEVGLKYPLIWEKWNTPNQFMDVCFPGGESKAQIVERFQTALEHIAQIEIYGLIGICTHGMVLSCFLQTLGRQNLFIENGEIIEVDFDGKNFSLFK